MNKKLLMFVFSFLSYIFMITLNALANALPLNGYNTGQLSDFYPNLFVPAGVTFSVWGIIYIFLFLFLYGLFKIKDKQQFFKLSGFYTVSCVLNGLWILAWHYKLIFISLIVMMLLLGVLINIYLTTRSLSKENYSERIIQSAISLYLGWISVATVANVTAFLVAINWGMFGFSEVFWTITMIIIVLLLTLLMLLREKDIIFSLVIMWALWGIIIKRVASIPLYREIILTAQISIAFIVLGILIVFLRLGFKRD